MVGGMGFEGEKGRLERSFGSVQEIRDGGERIASDALRFRRVGLSSDGAVVFCEMDSGKTYAMPVRALERAENWNPKSQPSTAGIIHDSYAAFVRFDGGEEIDFPSDFVLHICEPSLVRPKTNGSGQSGIGERIRRIRLARGMTLDALARKCGVGKPSLSRLENNKITPSLETLRTVAAALDTELALLVSTNVPDQAAQKRSSVRNKGKS